VGGIEYATSLFEPATVERYLGYFRSLLGAMVADDSQAVDHLPLLDAAERHRLLYEWNDTRTEFRGHGYVHALFEQQVAKTPDAVAAGFEDEWLSYEELNRRANRLAHYLRKLGVRADGRVAICLERGLEMLVGVLGVLKAGGAYVPLDPAYPVQHLRYIVQDSEPVAVLTQGHLRKFFGGLSETLPVININVTEVWWDRPEMNPDGATVGLFSQHLAYVVYTSGSTGMPKAVMVEHRGLCNLALAQIKALGVEADSRILQFASFSFDAYGWELAMSLCRGASLYNESVPGCIALPASDRSQIGR
jgi:non-ribosomal peptide synthetase component F